MCMDAEFENKIKEIGGMLGIENIPDNIGDIVESFLSSSNDVEDSASCNANVENLESKPRENVESGSNPDMFKLISTINNMKNNTQNDYKINFLQALKPLLTHDKHKKVDTCVNLLYFTKLAEQYKKIK